VALEPLLQRLPVQPFARALLLRSVVIWVGTRIMFAIGGIPAGAPLLNLRTSVMAVAVVAILGLIDARRRNEDLFLANLGVGYPAILAVAAFPALCLEILLLYALSWW
jgi:hypothetical protein